MKAKVAISTFKFIHFASFSTLESGSVLNETTHKMKVI